MRRSVVSALLCVLMLMLICGCGCTWNTRVTVAPTIYKSDDTNIMVGEGYKLLDYTREYDGDVLIITLRFEPP